MATYEDYINARCPKLATDAFYDDYVAQATQYCTKAIFGKTWDEAVYLYASHMYTLTQQAMGDPMQTGLVTGKAEGRTSISFWNDTKGSRSTFNRTTYGLLFKELIRRLGLTASVGNPEVL